MAVWRSLAVRVRAANRFCWRNAGFLLDQQAKPFGMLKGAAFGIGHLVAESLRHSLQAKLVQTIQRQVVEQGHSPQ